MRPSLRLLLPILLWLGLALGPVQAQTPARSTVPAAATAPVIGPRSTERIEAELVPMSGWATPGSTAIVAVRQKIQPGWHTYWRNPGDSGGPTTLDWALPAGVTAGEIIWPLPERQRLQSLMNYGYSDAVYLPVPITVPATARPGVPLRLSAEALFLVCSDEMCVPDQLTLALDVPVRDGAAPLDPVHGAAIQKVVETAPRPAGIDARALFENGALTITARGGPLAGATPRRAYFYPFQGGLLDHAAVQVGERGPQGLTLTIPAGRKLAADGLSGPVTGVLATDLGAWEVEAVPGAALPGTAGEGALATEATASAAAPGLAGFVQAALFALLGGLILNLMPCVFPILAMKAASLARSAHDPGEARRDGIAFLSGVLAAFVVLAGALLALRAGGQAIGWGFQLQSPAVVGGLALLMLAVGLNLSGVFEIGIGLQNAGSSRLSRLPGGTGAFFTGVLAVVVAAPCTAPFMAVALGAALLLPWPMALAVFLMLGLGLALPYVAISLSPGLLRRLPRPGAWMERLKAFLAFPMYGAALWLAWVFARQTGQDALALLFVAGLMAALSLWLFGLRQRERAEGRPGRLALMAAVIATAAFAAAGWIALRAPVAAADDVVAGSSGPLASQPWSEAAVATARAEGRPVLINFTADWCVTCKINERGALSSTRVAEAMTAANALYLVGDWTRRDDAITRELERHGRSGVPLYLFYAPGAVQPRILPQLMSEGVLLDALKER